MAALKEIIVVPFPHTGHIFPATELCNRLATRGCRTTILLPTPSVAAPHPLITIITLPIPINTQPRDFGYVYDVAIDSILSDAVDDCLKTPLCAVVDDMLSWYIDTFADHGVPTVSFFTSSVCSVAFEHVISKFPYEDLVVGRKLTVRGLAEDIVLKPADLFFRRPPPSFVGPFWRRPRGLATTASACAVLVNSCEEIEKDYFDYVANEAGKPVWGVGPLLADKFWASTNGLAPPVHDNELRPKHESSVNESEVTAWLDKKPQGSVIYVAFGSLWRPTDRELEELAAGLVLSGRPFIWVLKPNRGEARQGELARKAGKRVLVIEGWAPQLLILTHPSTGGYVCHCGWNSTVEALACGVPVLAWPVRGDQVHNARLMVDRLGVGIAVGGRGGETVTRKDVVSSVKQLMENQEIRERAAEAKAAFLQGYPKSSSASLDAFVDFVRSRTLQPSMQ